MDSIKDFICPNCEKSFSTKYTLKKHNDTGACKKNEIALTCSSQKCEYQTFKKSDLQRHIKTCKYIEIDKILEDVHKTYQKEIETLKRDIQYMEKENIHLTSLLEKAIVKPAVTNNTTNNNNNTNNNIRGNNNNLQSFLAPPELYEKQVDPERIKAIDQAVFEKHFWMGQKGMARFCVENIINTTDEEGNSKMLLCCTDPARKRFKYVGDDNHVSDDMEARHFIDKVSEPIVMVCRQVYDGVVKKIEDDKKETKDAFDLNFLENKTNVAQQKFLEINNIGDHAQNSDYKNEMTILLKK